MCSDKKNKPYLVGITSWGKENDADFQNHPGVFSHVLEYRYWIHQVLKEIQDQYPIRSHSVRSSAKYWIILMLFL